MCVLFYIFSMLFITETGVCITSGCSILVTLSFHCGNFHFIIDTASTVISFLISFVFTIITIHSGCIGVWFYFHQVLSYSPNLQTPLTSASFDSQFQSLNQSALDMLPIPTHSQTVHTRVRTYKAISDMHMKCACTVHM